MKRTSMDFALELRFFADAMLGKLARWLRLLGYDTRYCQTITDDELIRQAAGEGRIILTRDHELIERLDRQPGYLLEHEDPKEQLRELVHRFDLDPWIGLFSRCVYCNVPVDSVCDASTLESSVPPRVRSYTRRFYRCRSCGRVYWEGSHHDRIRRQLQSLVEDMQGHAAAERMPGAAAAGQGTTGSAQI